MARLRSFAAAFGRGFNGYLNRRSRHDQIEALQAKSDAELAAMGLTRDRIVHYVFRDMFHV